MKKVEKLKFEDFTSESIALNGVFGGTRVGGNTPDTECQKNNATTLDDCEAATDTVVVKPINVPV
jgi:hypothetical protein